MDLVHDGPPPSSTTTTTTSAVTINRDDDDNNTHLFPDHHVSLDGSSSLYHPSLKHGSVSPTAKYLPHVPTRGEGEESGGEDGDGSMDQDIFEIECVDEGVYGDERNTYSYANFLKSHTCYDMIPVSSKIIVFDSKLKVKKAFFALVHNDNLRSAPVWDTTKQEFVGMLTVTDFIRILIRYYKSPLEKMWELEEHQIETFRDLTKKQLKPYLIRSSPTQSIYSAVQILVKHKIHRLPVIDPANGNALHVITHKKILKYIFEHIDDLAVPDFMGFTLEQLGIGTFQNIATVHPWTTVIDALRLFNETGVSALPVVDAHNRSVGIYSKHDVINLAAERTYNNLDVTVEDALAHRQEHFEGVVKCYLTETLFVVIDRIANKKVHRLVVVDDEDDVVLGIVSLSDILKYLVIEPPRIDGIDVGT